MGRIAPTLAASLICSLCVSIPAQASTETEGLKRFRETYKELVETNTTLSAGDCTLAAQRMAARLKTAGYPDVDLRVFVPEGHPKEGGLLAVLHGSDPRAKAILMLRRRDELGPQRCWLADQECSGRH